MNQGIKEKQLPEKFAGDDYQLLLVAEKYQTGFDQPLLHTMYVDKRLAGVQAVQTLSRLNRTAPGKEDTFVLDFVNEPEEIYLSFAPYYEVTAVGEQASAEQLYALQADLNGAQIYYLEEVEGFCSVFFAPKATQSLGDHAKLNAWLDKAVKRFAERRAGEHGQEECEEFRGKLVAFRNLYAFLSQIIPYGDSDLEKLYTYVRFLIPKLPAQVERPAVPLRRRGRAEVLPPAEDQRGAASRCSPTSPVCSTDRPRSAPQSSPMRRSRSRRWSSSSTSVSARRSPRPTNCSSARSARRRQPTSSSSRRRPPTLSTASRSSSTRRWRACSSVAWNKTRRSPPSS